MSITAKMTVYLSPKTDGCVRNWHLFRVTAATYLFTVLSFVWFLFIFSQRLPWWRQPSYPHVTTALSPKSRGSLWSETRIHANGALDRRWETFREIALLIGEISVYMDFKNSCISGQSEENDDPKRTSRQTRQTQRQHPGRLERGLRRLQVHLHLRPYLEDHKHIINLDFFFKMTAATITIEQINKKGVL